MDVNSSTRKRLFLIIFVALFYPQDLDFQNVTHLLEQWEGLLPERNATSLIFIQSVKCCLDCLYEYIFRLNIFRMERIMLLCLPKALFFTTDCIQESSKI